MKKQTIYLDGYKKKYEEAEEKLVKLKAVNKRLREKILSYEKNWMLESFSYYQTQLVKYKPALNPTIVPVNASLNRYSLLYEINPKDVVCVLTSRKKKMIYLKEPIKNTEGPLTISSIVIVYRNKFTLEDMCAQLDKLNFWLVQVSDRAIVNVDLYHRFKDTLQLIGFDQQIKGRRITIGKDYVEDYQKVKDHFDDVISLQRLVSRGID